MSPVLWVLVVLGAGLSLAGYLQKLVHAGATQMENPVFRVFPFGDLPGWVIERMTPLREGFLALGFRDLVCYTRNSTRLNFSCILQSADHETNVSIWVSQYSGLMYWLILLQGWRVFRRNVRAEARYGLTTEFPDARRFETSPVEILIKATVPGRAEFLIVSEQCSLEEAVRQHRDAAQAFGSKIGLTPLRVTTQEGYFDVERALMARLAAKLRGAALTS